MYPTQGESFTQAGCSNRIPPLITHVHFGIKFPLCVFTQGENFTLLGLTSYTKLVEARQVEFQ